MKKLENDFTTYERELNEDIKFFIYIIEKCSRKNMGVFMYTEIQKIALGLLNNFEDPELNVEGNLHSLNYSFIILKNILKIIDKDSLDYNENFFKDFLYNFDNDFRIFLDEFLFIAERVLCSLELNNFLSNIRSLLENFDNLPFTSDKKEKIKENINKSLDDFKANNDF